MYIDLILWDDEDDPQGNIQHIAAAEITPVEVEEVLYAHKGGPDVYSNSSGLSIIFGTTASGKRIAVVYSDESDAGLIIVYPVTAYPVHE